MDSVLDRIRDFSSGCAALVVIAGFVTFWALAIYVAAHFVVKYW